MAPHQLLPPLPHRSNAMLLEGACIAGDVIYLPPSFQQALVAAAPARDVGSVLRDAARSLGVVFQGWRHGIHWKTFQTAPAPLTAAIMTPDLVLRATRAREGALLVHYLTGNLYHVLESFFSLYLTSEWRRGLESTSGAGGGAQGAGMAVLDFATPADMLPFTHMTGGGGLWAGIMSLFPVAESPFAPQRAADHLRHRSQRGSRPVCFDRLWVLGQQDLCSGVQYQEPLRRFASYLAARMRLHHPPLVQIVR